MPSRRITPRRAGMLLLIFMFLVLIGVDDMFASFISKVDTHRNSRVQQLVSDEQASSFNSRSIKETREEVTQPSISSQKQSDGYNPAQTNGSKLSEAKEENSAKTGDIKQDETKVEEKFEVKRPYQVETIDQRQEEDKIDIEIVVKDSATPASVNKSAAVGTNTPSSSKQQGHSQNDTGTKSIKTSVSTDTRGMSLSIIQRLLYVDCYSLFTSRGMSPENAYTESYIYAIRAHEEYIKSKSMIVEGNTRKYNEQTGVYAEIIKLPFIKTVCETGFNAGHDTVMWLASRPDTIVYSFDLGEHDYAYEMASILQKKFPNRLHLTWGDSAKSIPEFHKKNPDVLCDLVVIDGGHSYEVALADFDHFKVMTNRKNLVILDDYPSSGYYFKERLGPMWEGKKTLKEVEEHFSCEYKTQPHILHGFSIGRYLYD